MISKAKIPPKWIVGNWKMHKTIGQAIDFAKEVLPHLQNLEDTLGLAVPATCLYALSEVCKASALKIGAQNVHFEKEGAFTGEISAEMALDAGAQFTLIGHSERRHIFHETDSFIHKKVLSALQAKLKVILCIGETEEEKRKGSTQEVLMRQLEEGLKGVDKEAMSKVAIAYEPVWAIGTGTAASAEIAQESHAFCRELIQKLHGTAVSQKIKILYGGSVQAENVENFLKNPDIDGVLVGKGSLASQSFVKIVNFRGCLQIRNEYI